jgi:hypothetical protein
MILDNFTVITLPQSSLTFLSVYLNVVRSTASSQFTKCSIFDIVKLKLSAYNERVVKKT